MMKKKDLQKLSANLQGVFGNKNWHIHWQTYKLVEQWPKIAGKTIAEISMPAYVQKNILWVYVDNSIWMQQLQVEKTHLLNSVQQFNKNLAIKDIRWLLRPDNENSPKEKKAPNPGKELNPEEKKYIEDMTSTVENEQCRNALVKLWQTYDRNK